MAMIVRLSFYYSEPVRNNRFAAIPRPPSLTRSGFPLGITERRLALKVVTGASFVCHSEASSSIASATRNLREAISPSKERFANGEPVPAPLTRCGPRSFDCVRAAHHAHDDGERACGEKFTDAQLTLIDFDFA